jgi:hypothetical protein
MMMESSPLPMNLSDSLIHPDDIERVEKKLQHYIDNAEGYSIELR